MHGTSDTAVPIALDDALVAPARAVGVRREYWRVTGGVHGYDGVQFFTRRVTGTQTAHDRLLRFASAALR